MTLEVSAEYEEKELAEGRQPLELYRIWLTSLTDAEWTYTSGDLPITYNEKVYNPAPIERGSVEWDVELQVSKLEVTFAGIIPVILQYMASNPVELVWIEVLRAFRNQDPMECVVIFIGQIRSVAFQGAAGVAECVGMEFFLEKPIPNVRYQAGCNWRIYDERCKVDKDAAGHRGVGTVTYIDPDDPAKLTVPGVTDSYNWLQYGWLETGEQNLAKRMIIASSADYIVLQYPIPSLQVGDSVTFYAGCDGDITTCRDKFNNINNFGGHIYIPGDNPSAWSNY